MGLTRQELADEIERFFEDAPVNMYLLRFTTCQEDRCVREPQSRNSDRYDTLAYSGGLDVSLIGRFRVYHDDDGGFDKERFLNPDAAKPSADAVPAEQSAG